MRMTVEKMIWYKDTHSYLTTITVHGTSRVIF